MNDESSTAWLAVLARVQAVCDDLLASGKRIAIYGVGSHTLYLTFVTKLLRGNVVAFLDDHHVTHEMCYGIPVYHIDRLSDLDADVVLISVPQKEVEIAEELQNKLKSNTRISLLYSDEVERRHARLQVETFLKGLGVPMAVAQHEMLSEEQRRQYYAPGWSSFMEFYREQDWESVYCAEVNSRHAVENGCIQWDRNDSAAAKERVRAYAAERLVQAPTVYLEMGVRAGVSMKHMAQCLKGHQHVLHGFDTFTGLPDGWLPAWGGYSVATFCKPGEMAIDEIPQFHDNRIVLHKGVFQETLPDVLPQVRAFAHRLINIDCDIYSGALFTLTQIHPYLQKGDILYFDEFHDELNEYAAFNDYVRSFYTKGRFKLIARAYDAYCFEVV